MLPAYPFHQRLSNSVDNRVSGVELQFEGKLNLSGAVEAVVLPDTLADSKELAAALKKLNVIPLPYTQKDRMRPSEYVTTIFDLCYAYYRNPKVGLLP